MLSKRRLGIVLTNGREIDECVIPGTNGYHSTEVYNDNVHSSQWRNGILALYGRMDYGTLVNHGSEIAESLAERIRQ